MTTLVTAAAVSKKKKTNELIITPLLTKTLFKHVIANTRTNQPNTSAKNILCQKKK